MKTLTKILIISGLILSMDSLVAQTINWASLNDANKNIVSANTGYEYGLIYGLGYGRKFKTNLFPMVANVEYSFPAGDNIIDDFKTKIGVQVSWVEFHNFQFSTKIYGVFRRYENDLTRLVNFGSDLAGIVGYYRPKWFLAGEVGFDKAIATQLKHSNAYKDQFSDVVSGWFEPSTGGNFYYGLQTGLSDGKNDVNIRIGKILTQDFKTTPMIPYYLTLGYNRKF